MKKILFILMFLLCVTNVNAGLSAVVHNTAGATTLEDSITVSFFVTDSMANLSGLDSVFIAIWNAKGDSVFAAAYITTAAEIDSIDLGGVRTVWRWSEQISDIDASGRIGAYTGLIIAVDTINGTSADYLDQAAFFSFQLINSEYAAKLDSAAYAQLNNDSLNAQDDWVAKEASLFDPANDSVIVDGTIFAGLTDIITSTNIAANAIGASEIGDNAIGSAELAGDAITSATIAANAIGSSEFSTTAVDEIVDANWDELLTGATHNITNSSGKILRQIKGGSVIHDGTSDNVPANGANQISLETSGGSPTTSTIDNFYNHQRLAIVGGTGEGQLVIISDYNGTNQVATVTPAFFTTPDATSIYEILPGLVHAETQGGGYAGGAVWVSPSGTAGTQLYVNGTIDNPIDDGSFADAKTVADALGLTIFRIQAGANITLASTYNNYSFIGREWNLALGGQDLSSSNFTGAHSVTGIATGASVIEFINCEFGAVQLSISEFYECGFGAASTDSLLATGTGQYLFRNCFSLISGTLTPKFAMSSAVGNTKFGFRNYDGGLELSEIGSVGEDSVSIEGNGNLILNASNIGGELVIRGNFTITDNSSTTNITRDAALNGEYLTNLTWDEVNTGSEHNIANSTGKQLRELFSVGVIRSNTAQAGGTNVITLDASASASDGAYDPAEIYITGGTGAGQTRLILEYNGTTKVAVVGRNWKMIPDATSEFSIIPSSGREHVNEGMAQGGTSTTITLNALASSSNDAYNGQLVFVRSGVGDDQVKEVLDYNGTTKVASVRGTWTTTPTDSSGYVILAFASTPDTADILTAMTNNPSIAGGWGTGIDMTLKSLAVVNSAGTAVTFSSSSASGDGLRLFSTNRYGIYSTGSSHGFFTESSTNGSGIFSQGGATSGNGVHYRGRQGGGMFIEGAFTGGATGAGIQVYGGTGTNSTGDGINVWGEYNGGVGDGTGSGDGIDIHTSSNAAGDYGIEITTGGTTELEILAPRTWGAVSDSTLDKDTTDAFAVPAGFGKFVKDSTQGAGSTPPTVEQIDAELTSNHGVGAWTSSAGGNGLYTVAIVAIDTVNTDTLPSVAIAIKTSASVDYAGPQTTESDGFTPDWSIDAGTYHTVASRIGYIFPNKTFTISALDTIYIAGAPINNATPSSGNICTVSGYIYDIDGVAAEKARVTFELPSQTKDTCDNVIFGRFSSGVSTNSSGYFEIPLWKSKCLDASSYTMTVQMRGGASRVIRIIVPDQASYEVTF